MKNNSSIIGSIAGFLSGGMGAIAGTCGLACGACAGTCGPVCGSAALSLLGLGSGTTGAFLNRWQPLFIALSALAFGYAFYNLYFRKMKVENCSTDSSCECPPAKSPNLRFQKVFLWVALLVSIGSYGYPLFSESAGVAGGAGPGKASQTKAAACISGSSNQCNRVCDKPCQ